MLYKNGYIFTKEQKFVHGSFRAEGGRFTELFSSVPSEDGLDLRGAYVLPGLVDVHSHGNSGADFSDGNLAGLVKMAEYYAQAGVTSFAPASMTLPYEVLERAFDTAVRYRAMEHDRGARLMGINMEGPYFSEAKKGAQNPEYLLSPDIEGFKRLYEGCGGLIRIVDVAAELPEAEAFIAEAAKLCTVSQAHTDADYDAACRGFDAGATHLTHLFNAMPPLHHRKPGVIGAASERDKVIAELICDGIHAHPSGVRAAFKLFPGRICLVSDSVRCCGMPNGRYELGGQDVFLADNVARLADGSIAGSATNLYDCMRNALSFGIEREQAIASATIIPAREIGREAEIGSIEPGKYADFVLCGEALERRAVYLGGQKL